jgi:phage shock protein B
MRVEILVFLIPIVAIVCATIVSLAKNKREHDRAQGSALSEEETRIMRDLHQSLNKMEKRVEALETIIINKK